MQYDSPSASPVRHFSPHVNTRLTQSFEHCVGDFVGIRWHGFLRRRQIADDFPLTLTRNLAIAYKGGQDFLMPQILAPRLELFRGLANILAELDKGIPKAMWVEIWQASIGKDFAKDCSNRRGITLMFPCQPCHFKLASSPQRNICCRE
jgi:hypothetical protein